MTQEIRISPTKLGMFDTCPLAYHHRYRDYWEAPPSRAAKRGILAHSVLEICVRRRIGGGAAAPIESSELLSTLAGLLGDNQSEEQFDRGDEAHVRSMFQNMEPIALSDVVDAELSVALDLGDGVVAAPMKIDVLCVNEAENRVKIVDWKCGSAPPPTRAEAELLPGVGLYLAWARQEYPVCDVHLELRYLAWGPPWVTIDWSQGLEDYHTQRARSAARAIDAGYRHARVGPHCGRCDWKAMCKPLSKTLDRRREKFADLETRGHIAHELTDDELLESRYITHTALKVSEKFKEAFDEEIKRRCGTRELSAGGYRARIKRNKKSKTVEVKREL